MAYRELTMDIQEEIYQNCVGIYLERSLWGEVVMGMELGCLEEINEIMNEYIEEDL